MKKYTYNQIENLLLFLKSVEKEDNDCDILYDKLNLDWTGVGLIWLDVTAFVFYFQNESSFFS